MSAAKHEQWLGLWRARAAAARAAAAADAAGERASAAAALAADDEATDDDAAAGGAAAGAAAADGPATVWGLPLGRQNWLALCDLADGELQARVLRAPRAAECSAASGWFARAFVEGLRDDVERAIDATLADDAARAPGLDCRAFLEAAALAPDAAAPPLGRAEDPGGARPAPAVAPLVGSAPPGLSVDVAMVTDAPAPAPVLPAPEPGAPAFELLDGSDDEEGGVF